MPFLSISRKNDDAMSKVTVIMRGGEEVCLEGAQGLSVMEVIRGGGIDEVLALCGGCCSCATCHVYVENASDVGLEEMSEDEDDLLDSSSHRNERSRLSCQIVLTNALNGLRVTIAPED
jgi:2Fe-2S ferredoxin